MFKVATVQNRYNLVDRGSEDVLYYCEEHGIGFIPWFPLAAGRLAEAGSVLDAVANDHHATRSQIALAWMLKRSPVINIRLADERYQSWKQFLDTAYWTVELK